MKIDTTLLYGVRPPKHFSNCKVTDLDPLSAGAIPRLITVQMPDGDGASMHAMWHGQPPLAVNDFVRCRRDTADTNILVVEGYGGGSGASNVSGVWPAPGDIMIGTTEYATIAAAITAATAGDVIKLGEGTYNEILTISKSISIIGTGYAGRIGNDSRITSSTGDTITVSNSVTCRLKDLSISNTNDATTSRIILVNGTLEMKNCALEIIDEGVVTNVYGVQLGTTDAATLIADDCYILATGGLTLARAITLDNNSEALIYKGRLECDDIIADATSGSTVYVYNTQILGTTDKFSGAGAIKGVVFGDPHLGTNPMAVYRARVTHSVLQAITTSTPTALAFDTEREDTDQLHDTVTNNSRLTVETPGDYSIKGHVEWEADATGYRAIEVYLNGTTVIARETILSVGGSDPTAQSITTDYAMVSGDYVELRVWQNSGGNLNLLKTANYSPEFSITRVVG